MTAQLKRIREIALALRKFGADAYLLYDFRQSDPLAYRILDLSAPEIATRRWFCLVPARGAPMALVSAVEPHALDALGMRTIVYRSYAEMTAALRSMLSGLRTVAMNYSPMGAIPYVARVDAGTVEIVRSFGVEVISGAELIAKFEAELSSRAMASHLRAARKLRTIVDETFDEIRARLGSRKRASECSIQDFVMARIEAHRMTTRERPIVAVNDHSADPHFAPSRRRDRAIRPGDFILIDLWARDRAEGSIYADFTWTAFAGPSVPEKYARIFEIVARARDTAIDFVVGCVGRGEAISGRDADRVCRDVIDDAGFGANFVHRTGHSIGREVHGNGANLDSLETLDDRALAPNTCFSIEPGIYLKGQFGVRSEVDMTIAGGRARVSGEPRQRAIVALGARRNVR